MPRCGQAWAAGVHRGSQEAGGCKGTLGPTDAWFLSPHPHAWSDKHCVSISPGWQGTHFLGASCALRDFLPRHGLPASVAWHWGPLLAPAVCAQSTRGPDSCRPPLSPGSWSGRWPSEDPLASTCVCLKICTSLLVPTGLRRRRHCLEVSTCPSVWCCGLAGFGSGPGTVWGVSALQSLGCGGAWRLLIGLLGARSPGPGLSGDLPSHVWLLGQRADFGWAARQGPLPGSGWFLRGRELPGRGGPARRPSSQPARTHGLGAWTHLYVRKDLAVVKQLVCRPSKNYRLKQQPRGWLCCWQWWSNAGNSLAMGRCGGAPGPCAEWQQEPLALPDGPRSPASLRAV